jgi:hypothetical protein
VFAVWCAVSVPIVAFYYWTATSSAGPFAFRTDAGDHYNQLADGFLSGHLYLTRTPAPELLALPNPYDPVANQPWQFHDATLYQGHYYLYFGPVPVLTAFLPCKQLLKVSPSPNFVVWLYATVGYAFACRLLWRLLIAAAARPGLPMSAVAFAALGLAQFTPVLLRRPVVYEVAITAGFCFLMGGLLLLARIALSEQKPSAFSTMLAGFFLGLLPGCRPHLVLVTIGVTIWYAAFLAKERRLAAREWCEEMVWFCTPITICGVALLWYNWARFGSMFEFGVSHMLTNSPNTVGIRLSLKNVVPDLKDLLFLPPVKLTGFPFIELRRINDEPTVGSLVLMPLTAIGCALAPFVFWRQKRMLWMAALFTLSGGITLLFLSLTGNSNARYQLDYTPALWVLALSALLHLTVGAGRSWVRRSMAALIVAGCLWSAGATALLSIQGYDEGLEKKNPEAFSKISSWFGGSR